mgnify:CR=1 FL=1
MLNVFQSVLERYPFVVELDCEILMVGVVPPEDAMGAVAPTLVTGAVPLEAAVS